MGGRLGCLVRSWNLGGRRKDISYRDLHPASTSAVPEYSVRPLSRHDLGCK